MFITVDRTPIEYSRNSVYMECSQEQRGQDFGPGKGISPRRARVSCHTDGVTFFQVYVRLTYFWIS